MSGGAYTNSPPPFNCYVNEMHGAQIALKSPPRNYAAFSRRFSSPARNSSISVNQINVEEFDMQTTPKLQATFFRLFSPRSKKKTVFRANFGCMHANSPIRIFHRRSHFSCDVIWMNLKCTRQLGKWRGAKIGNLFSESLTIRDLFQTCPYRLKKSELSAWNS